MPNSKFLQFHYFSVCLEALLFGFYSGLFVMYLQYHASDKRDRRNKIIFPSLCLLYILSLGTLAIDILAIPIGVWTSPTPQVTMVRVQGTIFACSDFIAQSILIYRCWIVWDQRYRVVIVPSVLAFTFLVIWIVASNTIPSQFLSRGWQNALILICIGMSMTVNAVVTGLIVFKISKVFGEVKAAVDRILGGTRQSALRRVLFVIIESGMVLLSIQLARLVVTILMVTMPTKFTIGYVFALIAGIHPMLNGITPTIILVRVSMGLSFHDENSSVEHTTTSGDIYFAHTRRNRISDNDSFTGSTIIDQESRNKDMGFPMEDFTTSGLSSCNKF